VRSSLGLHRLQKNSKQAGYCFTLIEPDRTEIFSQVVLQPRIAVRSEPTENVVVEHDAFAGEAAFDVLYEISHGIAGAAERNADHTHDFLEPLICHGLRRAP
jgi:hypothetical protein